jgi:hypothetical protein
MIPALAVVLELMLAALAMVPMTEAHLAATPLLVIASPRARAAPIAVAHMALVMMLEAMVLIAAMAAHLKSS